jgi:hypothetical protein
VTGGGRRLKYVRAVLYSRVWMDSSQWNTSELNENESLIISDTRTVRG